MCPCPLNVPAKIRLEALSAHIGVHSSASLSNVTVPSLATVYFPGFRSISAVKTTFALVYLLPAFTLSLNVFNSSAFDISVMSSTVTSHSALRFVFLVDVTVIWVVPAFNPFTIPLLSTVAIVLLLESHVTSL